MNKLGSWLIKDDDDNDEKLLNYCLWVRVELRKGLAIFNCSGGNVGRS